MQHLRNATDSATRLILRAGAAVWLVLTVAAAAVGVDAAGLDVAPSRPCAIRRTLPQLEHLAERAAGPSIHRLPGAHPAGFARRHVAWLPRLHRTTAPWIQAASRGPGLRVPVDAIVDPLAERWQFDTVPAPAAPESCDLSCRLLRLAAADDMPARAPYLVRSFPRPPPAHL